MITCTFENGNSANLRHVTVGSIIVENNKILLAKRAKGLTEPDKWCLPGGYVNRDETTAEAAARETLEETGWEVHDFTLFRFNDNPNRPKEDRQNIDCIYLAQATKQTGETDWETQLIRWFPLDTLPPTEQIAFDHLDSIELYKRYCDSPFPLPVVGEL